MALVNMSEAARMAGVTRTTLYKRLKKGELSASRTDDNTGYIIDTSELLRMFPSAKVPVYTQTPVKQAVTPTELEHEIKLLTMQLEMKDRLIESYLSHISDLQTRLAHNPAPPASPISDPQPPRKGFWSRLFS